jgi:uncharacterized membrane protein YdjX (TVP38/TMEM64 family)
LVFFFAPTITNQKIDLSQYLFYLLDKVTLQAESDNSSANLLNHFILFIVLAITTSLGLPRQVAALVAGINLGAFWGAIIATFAATLGCLITFTAARYAFSEKIRLKYPSQLTKVSLFISEQTFLKAVVIRILPLGSNFLTNIIAGVTQVSAKAFVGGSFVGFIPQMIIFSLAGSGIRLGANNEIIISGILFIIALLITAYLVHKHKYEKRNES